MSRILSTLLFFPPFILPLLIILLLSWNSLPITTSGSVGSYILYRSDPMALLTGTLKTYQKAACDGEYMTIRCPTGTTISVQIAQYGKTAPAPSLCLNPGSSHPELTDSITDPYNNITCQLPSAIQTIVSRCQKMGSCKFKTSPATFGGDPCPGSRKYVEVAYKCRPTEFKNAIGCHSEVVQLKCNRSSRLAIYSANFGRTEYESVQCPQPKGVHEESCLSSFATETVMQLCHGKRRCALGVDPSTFGNPCKPESSMYLKVIYTCVPRKTLKEKYQGETEPDEMFEDETEYDTGDGSVGGVVEQPSIYSPDHSKGWVKSTPKPNTMHKTHSSEISESSEIKVKVHGEMVATEFTTNPNNSQDVHIIYLISQGIASYEYISRNTDKLWLYITISIVCCLVVIFLVLLVKIYIQRGSRRRSTCGSSGKQPSSSSAGPIVSSTGRLSDIDELSMGMEDITQLPSILRNKTAESTTSSTPRGIMAVSTVASTSSTLTTGGNNLPTPATMTLGRGIRGQRESTNIRFYYD